MLVALAVGAACFYGPFTHIHAPGQAEEHIASQHVSAGIAFHIHLGVRDDADPSWAAVDESARPLEWFRFEKARDGFAAPPPDRFGLLRDLGETVERTSSGHAPAPQASDSSPPPLRGPPAVG